MSHKTSEYYRKYFKLLNDEETIKDIANEFSSIHIRKKANREIFLQVLQNAHFLTSQGLTFWSDNRFENFDQLLARCQKLDSPITKWSNKNRDITKYMSEFQPADRSFFSEMVRLSKTLMRDNPCN